jgi:hypothetical protein
MSRSNIRRSDSRWKPLEDCGRNVTDFIQRGKYCFETRRGRVISGSWIHTKYLNPKSLTRKSQMVFFIAVHEQIEDRGEKKDESTIHPSCSKKDIRKQMNKGWVINRRRSWESRSWSRRNSRNRDFWARSDWLGRIQRLVRGTLMEGARVLLSGSVPLDVRLFSMLGSSAKIWSSLSRRNRGI